MLCQGAPTREKKVSTGDRRGRPLDLESSRKIECLRTYPLSECPRSPPSPRCSQRCRTARGEGCSRPPGPRTRSTADGPSASCRRTVRSSTSPGARRSTASIARYRLPLFGSALVARTELPDEVDVEPASSAWPNRSSTHTRHLDRCIRRKCRTEFVFAQLAVTPRLHERHTAPGM
jgi:hypothetical protein